MLIPTDTPTPAPPLSPELAVAITCESVSPVAVNATLLVPALTFEPPAITASLLAAEMFSAKEPATPVSPPLAPEVALAANVERESVLSSPLASMPLLDGTSASSVIPSAVMFAPVPMRVCELTSATLTATAMPTPVPPAFAPPISVALASAIATASVLFSACRLNAPSATPSPAVKLSPSAIVAFALEPTTLTASAPATWTAPSSVSMRAFPSVSPVVPVSPPESAARLSAKLCWL